MVKKTKDFSICFYLRFVMITLAVPSLAATRWVVLSSIHEVTEAPYKVKKKHMV
jgi:hypothetical protein